MSDDNNKSWWQTLPGILTGLTALITAVGGLLITLKSLGYIGSEPKKEFHEVAREAPGTIKTDETREAIAAGSSAKAMSFEGNVGKLEAVFNLSFDLRTNTVQGTYFYKKRQNTIYVLKGAIHDNKLELTEYTSGKITATCLLESVNGGCYGGRMSNTDGRVFNMMFCRIS